MDMSYGDISTYSNKDTERFQDEDWRKEVLSIVYKNTTDEDMVVDTGDEPPIAVL